MTKRKYKNYHKNPRIITDDQRTQLKKWIVEFGDLSGIVVNNLSGEKICGNQRGDAVNLNECEIDIIKRYDTPDNVGTVAEGFVLFDGVKLNYREVEWDERRAEQANIIANKAGGSWDWEILTEGFEIDDLLEWGFSEEEFAGKDVEVEPEETKGDDEVPEVQDDAETVKGDLWELGNHRLLCGDSTLIDDVERVLNGEEPNTMITDPPYGVKYEAGWRAEAKGRVKTKREESSNIKNDDNPDWYDSYVLHKGNIAYVWHASAFTDIVMNGLRKAGFEIKAQIIWNKNVHALSRSDYQWKHEPCWYAVKKGANHNWVGDRKQMTIWDIKNVIFEKDAGGKTSHPTQKPVDVYIKSINNHTNTGEYIYEPFGGSGSSIIAAEKTGRRSLTIELDGKYCDVIVKRYVKFCIENNRKYTVKLNGVDYSGNLLEV